MFNRKCKAEMIWLTCRITEPVKRLCRCESYRWKKIKWRFDYGTGSVETDILYKYK